MKLDDSGANFVADLICQHWEEITFSCYMHIEFVNVANWARDRIEQKVQP